MIKIFPLIIWVGCLSVLLIYDFDEVDEQSIVYSTSEVIEVSCFKGKFHESIFIDVENSDGTLDSYSVNIGEVDCRSLPLYELVGKTSNVGKYRGGLVYLGVDGEELLPIYKGIYRYNSGNKIILWITTSFLVFLSFLFILAWLRKRSNKD